jgi:hypothetical protein
MVDQYDEIKEWIGDSAWCKCGHHLDQHVTSKALDNTIKEKCIFRYTWETENCKCKEFIPYRHVCKLENNKKQKVTEEKK